MGTENQRRLAGGNLKGFWDRLLSRWRPRIRTLDLYITRRFLGIFLGNLLIFNLVYVLIDSLGQMDSFLGNSDGFLSFLMVSGKYYFYELPGLFCRLLGPVTSMASAMFAVTLTQRANEFVPILGTGTSMQRVLLPILLLAALVAAGSFVVQEVWIPAHRHEIRAAQSAGRSSNVVRHATHTDPDRKLVFKALLFYPLEQRASGLLIFSNRHKKKDFVINASEATWQDQRGDWLLRGVRLQEYGPDGRLIVKTQKPAELGPPLPDDVVANSRATERNAATRLSESFDAIHLKELAHLHIDPSLVLELAPQDLEDEDALDMYSTLGELRRKISLSPERHRWRVKYFARFVDPFHHLILILLGIPVILWRGSRNIFFSALLAVFLAAGYFAFQAVLIYLGNRGDLAPALATWISPIFFGSLGLTLYRSLRT